MGPDPEPTPPATELAIARSLLADFVAAEVTEAFRRAGIRSILLKGPAIARWLYEHVSMRPYVDCDLLVHPDNVEAAEAVLAALGFEHPPLDDIPHDLPWHAHAWIRNRDTASLDLHRTLIGTDVEPAEVWEALSADTDVLEVGNTPVETLGEPARALHVALHAAQDGGLPKPLGDLRRAIDRLPAETWEQAAHLAERLHAMAAFSAGLRLLPAGASLASSLGIPAQAPLAVTLRASGAPRSALTLEWLSRSPGMRRKALLVLRKIVPPAEFMRAWSPLAGHGRTGLFASYLWRLLWLAVASGPALRWWRRARRAALPRGQEAGGEGEPPVGRPRRAAGDPEQTQS